MLTETIIFVKEGIREFQSTGSLFPSSKWAAEALTGPLRSRREPSRILEVGPGSGPVTVRILKDMHPQDQLTICEINPRLMEALKKKLASNQDYIKNKDRVSFFLGPVQEMPNTEKFDLIICAIPFLNLDVSTVEEIFDKLVEVSSENSVMTYFEYIGIRKISKVVSPPQRKRRIEQLDSYFKTVYSRHNMKQHKVWLNLLPINIYKLELAQAA
jgi:phospholipid N-methyltransferase